MQGPYLRSWRESDAARLFTVLRANPDLASQFPDDFTTQEHAITYLTGYLLAPDSKHLAIIENDVAVGSVGLSYIDRNNQTGWASYWLVQDARGKGYAARGLCTLADWAFTHDLFRLELGHRVNNPASCWVAARAGFIVEGLERQKLRYGTQRFDVELHARLATDPTPDTAPLPMVPPFSPTAKETSD